MRLTYVCLTLPCLRQNWSVSGSHCSPNIGSICSARSRQRQLVSPLRRALAQPRLPSPGLSPAQLKGPIDRGVRGLGDCTLSQPASIENRTNGARVRGGGGGGSALPALPPLAYPLSLRMRLSSLRAIRARAPTAVRAASLCADRASACGRRAGGGGRPCRPCDGPAWQSRRSPYPTDSDSDSPGAARHAAHAHQIFLVERWRYNLKVPRSQLPKRTLAAGREPCPVVLYATISL